MSAHKTLVQALAQAQSEMSHATLDEVNPQFKSKFASLKSVIDAVKPALNKHGVWFMQKSVPIDNGIAIETVFYGYGEEIATGPVPVPAQKATPQGYGSAITYAKRYSLAMACGISAAQDDDGNLAEKEPPAKVSFADLETPVKDLAQEMGKDTDKSMGKPKPAANKKSDSIVDHKPKTAEEATVAVDALIELIRAMCNTVAEAKSMFDANGELVKNLEKDFPDERQRLKNAMGIFVKQLGEKK